MCICHVFVLCNLWLPRWKACQRKKSHRSSCKRFHALWILANYSHMFGWDNSLFAPPITSDSVYLASYISVFLIDFNLMSLLILLYIQHVYIFYFDLIANVDVSIMRQKSIIWKFFLTFLSLFIDVLVPSPDNPLAFQMLAKGASYDR